MYFGLKLARGKKTARKRFPSQEASRCPFHHFQSTTRLHIDASAIVSQPYLLACFFFGIREAIQVYRVPRSQELQLVESADFLTLVRWVRNSVGEK